MFVPGVSVLARCMCTAQTQAVKHSCTGMLQKDIKNRQALRFKASECDHSPWLTLNHLPECDLKLSLACSTSALLKVITHPRTRLNIYRSVICSSPGVFKTQSLNRGAKL